MGIHSEAILIQKFFEMAKLLNIYLNHFPKHEKYALCNTIRQSAYGVYDLITECQKRYYKKTSLSELDIAHEKLRMQLHLAFELGYFRYKNGKESYDAHADKRYLAISRLVDEIGKIIGAWIAKMKKRDDFK